jgi:tetratricopeptide (TPR) repeat protein
LHYDWPVRSFQFNWVYVLATAALAIATLVLVWRRSAASLLAACIFLILAPTHLVPILTEMAAERRMYLPLAALVVLAVIGGYSLLTRLAANPNARWPIASVGALTLMLGLVYGVVSAGRLAKYHDLIELWQENVDLEPHNHVAQMNLAVALSAIGKRREAIEHYRQSVRHRPDFAEGRYNLGLALAADGQLDEAIRELQDVVRQQPDAYRIRNNLGVVLFTAGRLPEAIAEFEKTLELRPDFAEAQENLNRARQQRVLPKEPQ